MLRRQYEILDLLIKSNRGIKGTELSQKFAVSIRTIRTDIKTINQLLDSYDAIVYSSKKIGYYIATADKEKAINLLITENNQAVPQTSNERLVAIIIQLTQKSMSLFDICDFLFVSESTAYSLITRAKALFKKNFPAIDILQASDNSYFLRGDEMAIRNLLSGLLSHNSDSDKLTSYLKYTSYEENYVEKHKKIVRLIVDCANENDFSLSGDSLFSMANDFLIAFYRNGYLKRADIDFRVTVKAQEIFTNLVHLVEKFLSITYSPDEFRFLFLRFLSKQFLSISDKTLFHLKEVEKIASAFLLSIGENNISFDSGNELHEKLTIFLHSSLIRSKYSFYMENPLKYELRRAIPFYFYLCKNLFDHIYDTYSIQLNLVEISYIAITLLPYIVQPIDQRKKILIISDFGEGIAAHVTNKIANILNVDHSLFLANNSLELSKIRSNRQIVLALSTTFLSTQLLSLFDVPVIRISPQISISEKELILETWNEIKIKEIYSPDLFTVTDNRTYDLNSNLYHEIIFSNSNQCVIGEPISSETSFLKLSKFKYNGSEKLLITPHLSKDNELNNMIFKIIIKIIETSGVVHYSIESKSAFIKQLKSK